MNCIILIKSLNDATTRLQSLSIQNPNLILPAKIKTTTTNIFKLNSNSASTNLSESTENILNLNLKQNDDDNDSEDYDYDIPENNRPAPKLAKQLLKTKLLNDSDRIQKDDNQSRKSISPTIDSGISASSLMSLNSENLINQSSSISDTVSLNQRLSDYSMYGEITKQGKQNNLHVDFEEKIEKLNFYFEHFLKFELTDLKEFSATREKLIGFRAILEDFLITNLKTLKQDHACFHPDLNTFNKFKQFYRQIKDFYLYFESILVNTYEKTLKWNFELVKQNQTDFYDLITKLDHLKSLLDQLRSIVNENYLFDYHSESSSFEISSRNQQTDDDQQESDYQYEYDNNCNYREEPDSDYCEIDEEEEEKSNSEKLEKLVEKVSNNTSLCMTLKRSDEKIRREIRLATSENQNESTRITMSDQMLLKFYLKHIEDNFNDLRSIYDVLSDKLRNSFIDSGSLNELANKLALNGHKLVFICDTLQRNINNGNLKMSLFESSNSLCDSLKLYMIRIKSSMGLGALNLNKKQNQLVLDSLNNVFSSADQFKQIVLKYFFNNY